MPHLKVLEVHKQVVADHKDRSDDAPKVSWSFHISKALDILPNYLCSIVGVRGTALSYVIRANGVPQPLEPLEEDLPYSAAASSLMVELIDVTPHDGVGWDEDNATVFGVR